MQTRHVMALAAGTALVLGASAAVVIGALGGSDDRAVPTGRPGSAGASSAPARIEPATDPATATGPAATEPAPAKPAEDAEQAPHPDFGFIVGLADTGPGEPQLLMFDRATLLTGEAAVEEAASRGEEAFDYYVVNDNPKLRELAVSDTALTVRGSWFLTGQPAATEIGPDDLFHYFLDPAAEKLPVELRYDGSGRVVEVTEIYFA